ncbi:hypothetical protein FOXYSP1_01220 [Fusarium oxysporum f. sp. phaseoli]
MKTHIILLYHFILLYHLLVHSDNEILRDLFQLTIDPRTLASPFLYISLLHPLYVLCLRLCCRHNVASTEQPAEKYWRPILKYFTYDFKNI